MIKRTRGYARTDLVMLADQVGELARDANAGIAALEELAAALEVDVAAIAAAGTYLDFSGIRITHTGDTTWSSTTWTGVTGGCLGTVSTVFAEGTSRSGSDITFNAAGRWAIHGQAIVRVASAGHWSLRLRDTSGGVTKAIGANYLTAGGIFAITGVFETTASQQLQLQYCTSGTDGASSSAGTLDSEAVPTLDVSIWRVA